MSYSTSVEAVRNPIYEPEIANKIKEFNNLVDKIVKMTAVKIFCVEEEHDSGVGYGSNYTYRYYTSKTAAVAGLNPCSKLSEENVVMDTHRDLYKVTWTSTLQLVKLKVNRHFEEEELYRAAQESKAKNERKLFLLQQQALIKQELANI